MKQRTFRSIAVDTLAMFIFNIFTCALMFWYEVVILKMGLGQLVEIRIAKAILKYSGARLCGKLTDWLRLKIARESKSWFKKALSDSLALAIYQIPIHLISALCVGLSLKQAATMSGIYFLNNLASGWIYGLVLDWTRNRFRTVKAPRQE